MNCKDGLIISSVNLSHAINVKISILIVQSIERIFEAVRFYMSHGDTGDINAFNRVSSVPIRNFQDYLNLYLHHYKLKYYEILALIMPLKVYTLQGIYYAYKIYATLSNGGCNIRVFKPTDSTTKHRPPMNMFSDTFDKFKYKYILSLDSNLTITYLLVFD